MRRLAVALALAALTLGAAVSSAQSVGGLQFTDWTATGGTTATGTLLGHTVTLSGWHLSELPANYLDGTGTFFSAPYFAPPLPHSDAIEFRAENAQPHDYTLSFGAPTTDPVLHLGSLGTTLQFPLGTSITRVSGKNDGFAVSGSTIIGAGDTVVDAYGLNDSNGTVRLNGTFTSITFTATTGYALDGIMLQVGAPVPPSPTATPTPPAPTPTPTPTPVPTPPPSLSRTVDIRVSGIEVTQAVQASGCAGCEGTLPSRAPVVGLRGVLPASTARYQGVRMTAGKLTVARVFATFTSPADQAELRGVTAKLEVLDSNANVIGTLTPDSAPAALKKTDCWTCVTAAQRADAAGSFYFTLPWQWTYHRQLSLRATVTPIRYRDSLLPVSQCSGCHANVFTLTGVPFVPTATVPVHPIPLTVGGIRTPRSENQVFGDAQTVLPVRLEIRGYEAALPVDGMNSNQAAAAVAVRASDDRYDSGQYPIGVFVNGTPGLGGLTLPDRVLFGSLPPVSIVRDQSRPLTSVTHEIGHGLGLLHADTGSNCSPDPAVGCPGPHPDGTPDCGGNSNLQKTGRQFGQSWFPDDEGRLNSVGLDRRAWDLFRTGSLPRPIVEDFPNPGNRYYDFMSYCASTNESTAPGSRPDAWISLTNWNRLLDFHPPAQALAATAAAGAHLQAAGTRLRVIATIDAAAGASIFDVTPGQGTAVAPTPGTSYRLELRDAAGGLLASVVPNASAIHVDGGPGGLLLEGTLPSMASATAVTISAGGREVARRARSPHAPTLRLVGRGAGSRIGHGRTTRVRWVARDADADRLTATVDYSRDGGRTWKVVADRVRGGSARIQSRLLSASRNARLSVRVSDGFNLATARSGRLIATGAPPRVQILDTGRRGTIRADQALLLQGAAFDDTGRALTDGRLKWYAGRRLIGHGERLTARHLPPRATRVRLEATDSRGRTSQATLPIRVRALEPIPTVVRAPAEVSAHARRIKIAVASNVPAVLTIAGARHKVAGRPRTIPIRIRPGRSTLRFPYTLRSPGGVTRGVYVVSRRG